MGEKAVNLYSSRSISWLMIMASSLLAGCSLLASSGTPTPFAEATQAQQTVQARLTESSTPTPLPAATVTPTVVLTLTPTLLSSPSTPQATFTATTAILCDKAAPGSPIDVTIEDGTIMQPGQRFTKTWRLVNAGSCTWTRSYKAIWFYGEKFGDTLTVPFAGEIPPKSSLEITVDMVAPTVPGSYRSNWKLQNSSGDFFGIGPDAAAPFWVQITVVLPTAAATSTSAASSPTATSPTAGPSPTANPTPEIQVSGSILLEPGTSIDLDSITINPSSGADLSYTAGDDNTHWLNPQEGGLVGVYGSSEPAWTVCQGAGKSSAPIALESLSRGTYLCFFTGDERYGWLRYDNIDTGDGTLEALVLTWK